MSFQDVGKSRPSSRIRNGLPQLPERTIATLTGKIGNSGSSVKDDASNDALDPRLVSDLILSYQREVGTLSKLIHTMENSSAAGFKLRMKFDELRKLGDRIEGLLKQLLNDTVHVDKNRLSERRATQIKLTRDFRKMEVMHKNLEMDFRQRVGRMSSSNNSSSYSTLSSERQVPDQRDAVQLQLRLEEETAEAEQIMRDRETEVREINRKMHQVNAIYKDLGELVSNQQEQVDQVEVMMDAANVNAKTALHQIEDANGKAAKREAKKSGASPTAQNEANCNWMLPIETMQSGFAEMGEDFATMKKKAMVLMSFGHFKPK